MKRLAWLAALLAALTAHASDAPLAALQARLDALVQRGYDAPEAALAEWQAHYPAQANAGTERAWRLARGQIEARAGLDAAAQASAAQLDALRRSADDPMASADAELVRALADENAGRLERAGEHAQNALTEYERLCGKAAIAPRPDCDHRSRWAAIRVLAVRAGTQGLQLLQRQEWESAVALAQQSQDLYREAYSLAALAAVHARANEFDPASRLMSQATRIARLQGSTELMARVKMGQSRVNARRGDGDRSAAIAADEEALRLAQEAHSPRLEAVILANLSDDRLKNGQPKLALEAVERALPVIRRYHEVRAERTLLHNASLARLALHQVGAARQDFERVLALWRVIGEGDEAIVLREFGDGLAAAGDLPGALELYHRERKLVADIMARNRELALRELQGRYDREAKQRNIELLERDNALKSARLANRALLQKVWGLLGVTLSLAMVFAVLLYLRVRETQRQLERSHAKLRVQSERDPLTGLANRRHFQDVMRQREGHLAFEGALLLLDIDHFKHINDGHGHAAGDEVLTEVAHRLADAVRADDLVVRWGGEEFLVFAPQLDVAQLEAFAGRLLHAVGDAPIGRGREPIRVTTSIGYAHFPIAPQRHRVGWERALNIVDMALYTAKSLGRNRAVGIVAAHTPGADELQAVERDFERAWSEGRVELRITEGR